MLGTGIVAAQPAGGDVGDQALKPQKHEAADSIPEKGLILPVEVVTFNQAVACVEISAMLQYSYLLARKWNVDDLDSILLSYALL